MNVAELLLPDFTLIVLGHLLCRFTPLNRNIWQPVESLVYFVLFPVLLFHAIVKSPLQLQDLNFAFTGVVFAIGTMALVLVLPKVNGLSRHWSAHDFAGSAQIGFRFNSYIALAVAERAGGAPSLLLMAMLIGFCVPLYNVGAVWPMVRQGQNRSLFKELLRNPLVIATTSGLVANWLGFRIPLWLEPAVARVGSSALALGLMAAGAGLLWQQLGANRLLSVCLLGIRHAVAPVLAYGLAMWIQLSDTQTLVLMIFSALPTSSAAYVLASRMGFNGSYVAGLITLSIGLSVISLSVVLSLFAPQIR
jgi:predicted permease